jgi:REP element-mobilizing transposase RayT
MQFSPFPLSPTAHGGVVRLGKRKCARPIAVKRPMHLVMRSTRARGDWSFLHKRNKGVIQLLLLDCAERFGVKIFRYENVGNHMHLLVQARSRKSLQAFLRVFPQRVMFAVTGARCGSPKGRFFDRIVFSRVVEWGREFRVMQNYLWKNAMESLGFSRSGLHLWNSS